MSEQGGPTPRRALPPRDDEPASDTVDEAPEAAHRRGLWSATSSEAGTGPTAGTPIPPPAVLPPSEGAPASAGRRFSAADLPADEDRPLPRRSALSPAATRAQSPRVPDEPTPDAVAERPRRRGLIIGAVVALLLAGAAVAAYVVLNQPGAEPAPAATPTPTVDPVATYLLQDADLTAVREGTTWNVVATAETADATTPAPRCLVPVPELETQPASLLVRTFSPSAGEAAGLLHQVETYATAEEAEAAYTARVTQLGACERNTAWVEGGKDITGLADESTGSSVVLQGTEPEFHTIVVSRTGTRVNVVDGTQTGSAMPVGSLLPALSAVFERQCAEGGTCPRASAAVVEGVPAAADPFGFLAGVDLPRITAGAGEWRGTPVTQQIVAPGTRCEGIDLTQAQGATALRQRTLLLQDDAAAPQGFGVDEVVYTFGTPEEANALAATLTGNIDGCADRTATATVARTGDLGGPGTGTAWVVTQKVDQAETTARFRVAVVVAGNHLVYLMANPSGEFDFPDEGFHQVALRAAQRLTQLP